MLRYQFRNSQKTGSEKDICSLALISPVKCLSDIIIKRVIWIRVISETDFFTQEEALWDDLFTPRFPLKYSIMMLVN